jgi:hypothetical protein
VHDDYLYGGYANAYTGSSKAWTIEDLEQLDFIDGIAYDT